jgi:hypothetical protein
MVRLALVGLAALEVVSAGSSLRGDRSGVAAFASTFTPVGTVQGAMSTCSMIAPSLELKAGTASLDDVAQGAGGLTMGCRRNLKKEKRLRNEQCARQFRKPKPRFGGRPMPGAKKEENNNDSDWLAQIYGVHTIYRRDQPDLVAARDAGVAQQEKKKEEAVAA